MNIRGRFREYAKRFDEEVGRQRDAAPLGGQVLHFTGDPGIDLMPTPPHGIPAVLPAIETIEPQTEVAE